MIEEFSTDSYAELLSNLDICIGTYIHKEEELMTSSYSGWIPIMDVLLNINERITINTENPSTIPYYHFSNSGLPNYNNPSVFYDFNNTIKSHLVKWKNFRYTNNGEEARFYAGPGTILREIGYNQVEPLFMICLSNEFFMDIILGSRNTITKPSDIKLFMDYELTSSKYQKIYKVIDAYYIQPLLKKGVELCIKPSNLFMKEVVGNEFIPSIVSEEEYQEFNRLIREEIF